MKRLARSLGYTKTVGNSKRIFREHLGRFLAELQVDTVIEVGANKGQYGRTLRKSGFGGDIFSFEPVPAVYKDLSLAAQNDARWHTFNMAMGASCGSMEMNVMDASLLSSFHQPSSQGQTIFDSAIEVARKEMVDVSTIDNFFAEQLPNKEQRTIFLKIDTQGFDLEVFRGAAQSLGFIVGLQSELSLIPLYEGMPNYLDAIAEYVDAGFAVNGFFPVCLDKSKLCLAEVDCLFVNSAIWEQGK